MAGGPFPDDEDLQDLDPDALARAEAALANLSDRYIAWATADQARLEACLAEMLADSASRPDLSARLFTIAHDMKGQAATFGYPLITDLGNRLCRLVEAGSRDPAGFIPLVAAMGRILAERLAGDGGAVGRRLMAELG
jgi:hypothetical protein